MQTRTLSTLVAISKVGSFAEAADQLNMTLSAVSMQMKSLEAELDANLFDRSFRPPKLTPLGRLVAAQAVRLLEAEGQLIEVCRGSDELAGHYRIGFVATASVRLLPDFLVRASERVPSARFKVEVGLSEALERKVLNGQLDAAVVTASQTSALLLHCVALRDEPLVFATPRSAGQAVSGPTNGPLCFLQFAPDTGVGKLIAAHMKEQYDLRSSQTLVLDSVEAIMECVNRGIGFTLLPEPDVRRYVDHRGVVIRRPKKELVRQLVVATLPTSPIGLRIDQFAGLFKRRVSKHRK